MKLLLTFLIITTLCYACDQEHRTEESETVWYFQDFSKIDSLNPILYPDTTQSFLDPVTKATINWEERNVLNPTAVIRDGRVHMIYRAQDHNMTSRLGMAVSQDGLHFQKIAAPIFFPDKDSMNIYEWPGGVEDPRIVVDEDGRYIMTYTAYDGKTARLCLASSRDLQSWTKHGLVLSDDKYQNTWSKSGAIVSKLVGDKIIATKIDGKYWMYFGDTDLFMASSEDLIRWQVLEDLESGKMIAVLHPRPGYFDSRLVEPGPYALLKEKGVLLIYNASNSANYNDASLPKFTYAAGQALFNRDKPYQMIDRTDGHFIHPDKDYERIGEVNEVCFVEGLVYFKNQWFLYYGTADSKIAVAVAQ